MDVLSILAVTLGIIGFAGGAVGYFAKGRGDSIIAYQSNEIALRDGTIARQKEDLAATTAERDALKRQNADLVNLAQGSPELVKLTKEIKNLTQNVAEVIKENQNAGN